MPRKPRIEFAGAIYHVLNRGNYRQGVFGVHGAAEAFERVLFDTCSRFGWRLFAYVVMSNHYHLCLQTEDANLVSGMQWLQSTFANRFNRFVGERGHVFQGRYQALLVEEGPSVLRVVNYIHLNPVRAGIANVSTLEQHVHGSFSKFLQATHPSCLEAEDWLHEAGNLRPTAAGFSAYRKSLSSVIEADPDWREELYRELCRGWYVGTQEGKMTLLDSVSEGLADVDKTVLGFGQEKASALLQTGLVRLSKASEDLVSDLKLADWKVVLASWIKLQCGVSNRWLSENLHMGSIYSISKAVCAELREGNRRRRVWRKLVAPKP
jgi:REP element-mobilizing transposase RayT